MLCVENEFVRLAVDKRGNLTELVNRRSGQNYAGGLPLWRLIYSQDDALENQIIADDLQPTIRCGDHHLTMEYALAKNNPEFDIRVTAELHNDEVHWSIELKNNQQGTVIREIHFPMINALNYIPGQAMIWSGLGGQIFKDIREILKKNHTQYMACDHESIRIGSIYPGNWTATNSFLFADETEGLYFGSHDLTFQQTMHLFELKNDVEVSAGFVKYPYLQKGQTTHIDGYVTSPYSGTWHTGAKKYRAWADNWFKVVDKPETIRTMKGWQRIILKHQYGEIHYHYDQLKQIHEEGAAAGIDNLLLFGWTKYGHDNGYPDYSFDESQGGEEALKKHIREFQDAGGKVILYFNGHLIDKTSAYYASNGNKICAKDFQGNEYQECYRFGGAGTALRQFGYKTFVGACPSQLKWFEKLKEMVDLAFRINCDGVFFDQMGGWDNVQCCDPSHGHPIPFTTIGRTKAELLAKLRNYIKTQYPEKSFGTEILSDITAQHMDYVHNLWGGCPKPDEIPSDGSIPQSEGFIEWFRYIFPEIILTDRDIRDDTDIERRVNHALLKGLRSDVEIYRCRRTIAETPYYSAYLKQANRLREKYSELILAGRYVDTDGFTLSNRTVDARAFTSGNRLAVILTQSHLDETSVMLKVGSYHFVEYDGLGKFHVDVKDPETNIKLNRHALAIIIFEK
jgi:hypothetical protein